MELREFDKKLLILNDSAMRGLIKLHLEGNSYYRSKRKLEEWNLIVKHANSRGIGNNLRSIKINNGG